MKSLFAAGALLAALFTVGQVQALQFDADVPQDLQTQMTTDFAFITTIQASATSQLHSQVYGPVSGATYDSWFNSRILRVGFDNSRSDGAVAYVAPMIDSNKMFVTQNYTGFNHPQIARLMIVFHEARHTEGANNFWSHTTCPTPFLDEHGNEIKSIWTGLPLAGHPGCDDTAFGAYGSSTIMMKNISLYCTSCTDKVKMDAGIYADDQINRLLPADARQAIRQDTHAF